MQQPLFAVFFVYVWPEPLSSAAGVRTRELLSALQERGWRLACVSPASPSPASRELESLGIAAYSCDPNASAPTEETLRRLRPGLVVYDRFVMEEQFGWRARALWPSALHLVDTQDLHCVRRARESLAREGAAWERVLSPGIAAMGDSLLRELASLYRADGALVVSSWEHELLVRECGYPPGRLLCLPFPTDVDPEPSGFSARSGFGFLGNFRHPPNLDSARWLLGGLWSAVRARLPGAELHLYGAYPPAEISRHKGTGGAFAHGPVTDHRAALRSHRALLAPLRFGAGIKGKVLEAWGTGTPVVGSPLAFEGMGESGLVARTAEELAEACMALESEAAWRAWQERSLRAAAAFDRGLLARAFLSFVEERHGRLEESRSTNLVGRMLCLQQNNSTKYFSRWIEAKQAAILERMSHVAKLLRVRGRVQGVCYRESMRAEAERLGVAGWVRNREDGSVEAFAQGAPDLVEALIAWAELGPPRAEVESVSATKAEPDPSLRGFQRRETV